MGIFDDSKVWPCLAPLGKPLVSERRHEYRDTPCLQSIRGNPEWLLKNRETSATGSNRIDVVLAILCKEDGVRATPDPDI